jgi:predicted DCC family thiol-disulfide oxidoreductase YuxK
MEKLPVNKKIVLFDGVCNLCNSAVQFVIKHDKKDNFRFVALQSELGQEILTHIGISTEKLDSIILYEPGIVYHYKSTAVLEIAKSFGGFFNLFSIFNIIPAEISNKLYDFIAKNRYQWFGQKEHCLIPTKELQSKFL